jgi:hypothetical protein
MLVCCTGHVVDVAAAADRSCELQPVTGSKRFDRDYVCLLQSDRSSRANQTARYGNVPEMQKARHGLAFFFHRA